jgi:hypothetical protein
MDTIFGIFEFVWIACAVPAFVSGVLAGRSDRARHVGRIGAGLLMLVGGAVFNTIVLAAGGNYSGFADGSWFRWVTDTWEAVLVPNHLLFIGLLVAYEATVGVLILSGGRGVQLGLVGAIGFLVALCVFGPQWTVFPVIMLPALALLLRAERHAAPSGRTHRTTPAGTPSADLPDRFVELPAAGPRGRDRRGDAGVGARLCQER